MSRIGVDVGTSRVKAVRFDDEWGEVDSAGESTVVLSSPDGRREQDMEQVWEAVARVVTEVVSRCPDQVELVAVTAQGDGTWLIDAEGRPVGEALLWNDNRAARLIDRWQLDGVLEEAFRTSGSLGAPGLANAQLRWLREHEPRRLESATTLLSCGSWVYHRLTGERVLERSDAANPFCDARTWEYDHGLLELFDLSDLQGLLPPVVSGSEAVAPLRADVAERLGLPPATPVALASYDVVTSAVGSGVGRSGTAMAVLGTTLCVGVAGEDPLLDRTASGMTLPSGTDGRWLVAFATLTGTEALDWAARTLGLADAASVARLAATSTRTDLPLFLPYLSPAGERAPFLDPDVRGGLRQLRLDHSQADVARAVLEGLTLAVVDCLDAAGPLERLALCGGGARSDTWSRMIADAAGVPVVRPTVSEVGACGAALQGAAAVGGTELAEVQDAGVRNGELLEPQAQENDRWRTRLQELRRARRDDGAG